ncbi:hypothetical protein D6T64_20545 [Cryobacterium melibiosiphilum]|uniref:DUF3099 domain-containing protein n=1 Tax=Cryobacterium melibiosiphilum TaxID=995039 RepID=A0A3A5MJZ1_9MICO|nr:hypothetical protein [Cryobacterium melibiosiphilum]RJT84562.1 hypothetical protein D6T64_20545 [Cryobacterium melibiosiphilum]
MATPPIDKSNRIIFRFAIFYSAFLLGLGIWVSVVLGDWLPLLIAVGLIVVPMGGLTAYNRRPTR